MKRTLIAQIALATILFGTLFVMVQQQGRLQANDTPEMLATQVGKQLDAGLGLQSINMGGTDLANKPVPFVIVYDKKGKAVAGSGYLNKKLAVMPTGVINHATKDNPHAVTWAPGKDIRIASVTVAAKDYYVTGGQSLRSTDSHAKRLLLLTLIGYLASLIGIVYLNYTIRRYLRSCQDCHRKGAHIEFVKKTAPAKATKAIAKSPAKRAR